MPFWLTLILPALINLLVYFIEQWWTNTHPTNPAATKAAYLAEVGKAKYFWMGPKRLEWAGQLHDGAVARYVASPPVVPLSDAPLTAGQAHALASQLCDGLSIPST